MSQTPLATIRRDLHRHPETAFEEHRTADIIARELKDLGLDVTTGLAGTGVIGTMTRGHGPSVGLRADMDALHMDEENDFEHRSVHAGKMHGCGHDGHMAMLLGAARQLTKRSDITGTVHFVFQPAEENEGGGRAMIENGLFDEFPMERIFGMHNWPGLDAGRFAICPGPIMAAFDVFTITLRGCGAHAAMPHQGSDSIVAAAQMVSALQVIAARKLDPQRAGIVSVTAVNGGDTWNVLPEEVTLRGCTRHFTTEDQSMVESTMRQIVEHTAAANGVEAHLDYEPRYPATVNTVDETELAIAAAQDIVGAGAVETQTTPSMASEDFGFMLRERPGSYIWIGNGPGTGGCALHNPLYDFNDDIIGLGANYWERLVELNMLTSAAPGKVEHV
ncbi:MAG: M20 aminoacylase family protein [Pseudomonadota bacterium]